MGWHRRDGDWRADYEHDQRKNWQEPTPIRLELTPHSTAMDCALIVQRMTNLVEAGGLIERYAKAQIARANLDATLDRIAGSDRKRHAIARLIDEVEAICGSGRLPETTEAALRGYVAETLSAFGMCAANREEREPEIGASA